MGEAPQIDWSEALAEHFSWLRRVVGVRLGERQAVEEVLQEVALAVVRQQSSPRDPAKVPPWLYRIAVRATLLYRRKIGRQRRLLERYARRETIVGSAQPVDWLLADERQNLVRAAMARLPARAGELLVLKYTENWTNRRIADRLGLSESAVETRLHRARKQLREELSDR